MIVIPAARLSAASEQKVIAGTGARDLLFYARPGRALSFAAALAAPRLLFPNSDFNFRISAFMWRQASARHLLEHDTSCPVSHRSRQPPLRFIEPVHRAVRPAVLAKHSKRTGVTGRIVGSSKSSRNSALENRSPLVAPEADPAALPPFQPPGPRAAEQRIWNGCVLSAKAEKNKADMAIMSHLNNLLTGNK